MSIKFGLPLKGLNLNRYPNGNLLQGYGENCALYTQAFEQMGSPSKCHNGLDLYTFKGDNVLATHDGNVLKADFGETTHGYGVWLRSPDYIGDDGKTRFILTCYFHLTACAVQTGQAVKKGDTLGWEGNTGFIISGGTPYWGNAPDNKGVHLHYGEYPYFSDGTKEFPDNDENGAIDPLPCLQEAINSEIVNVVNQSELIVNEIASSTAPISQKLSWLQTIWNALKSFFNG